MKAGSTRQTFTLNTPSHTIDSTYHLGLAMELKAVVLYTQHRLKEARSDVLRVADVYEKLGIAEGTEACRTFVQQVQKGLDGPVASDQSPLNCELL